MRCRINVARTMFYICLKYTNSKSSELAVDSLIK